MVFVLRTVTKPIAGDAYDRVGAPITVVFVSGLPTLALPFVAGRPALVVVTTLIAPLLGSGVVATALILEAISGRVRGTAFGFIPAATFGIAAASPSLFGAAADPGFFDEGFMVLAVLSSSMIPLAWLLRGR